MANTKKQKEIQSVAPEARATVWISVFVWCVIGCAGILTLWAIGLTVSRSEDVGHFAALGWGASAGVIVGNKIRAMWHAAIMTSCAAGFMWLFLMARTKKPIVYEISKWSLVLLVVGDVWMLSRHYVKTMPVSALNENAVITLLKSDMPVQRVALTTQEGFYNWWLTFVFPYYGIQSVNVTQMPRMPNDYKNFLSTVGRNPIRFWQLAAVGYVLAPVQVWDQLQRDPAMRNLFDLRLAYNVAPGPEGMGVTVMPASPDNSAQHVVLRFKHPGPRYALFAGTESCGDDEALRRLASPAVTPFRKVLVAPEYAMNVPPLMGEGMLGKVEVLNYRAGRFHFRTTSDQPAFLRIAEKFSADWKGAVDGRSTPVVRADYIFQGIFVPAGTHDVILQYKPDIWPFYVQLSGMFLCMCAIVWLIMRRFTGKARQQLVQAP